MPYIKKTSRRLPFEGPRKDFSKQRWGNDLKKNPYNNNTWRTKAKRIRTKIRVCIWCNKAIVRIKGIPVDHTIPIEHGGSFEDERNLSPLHVSCHNSKTAQEKSNPVYKWKLNDKGEKIPIRDIDNNLILNK